MTDLYAAIERVPPCYTQVRYKNRKYGLTRTDFNQGKSLKIYGEELGGSDFISCNYYQTQGEGLLKPCEMPASKVLDFLKGFRPCLKR